ncbi:MAG: cache domain-containing protein [Alphaproteobacteria bacterium]|nr:hypothetical protein [Rhodospirillaceae bacterium]MBT6205896.1 hypothetical protein [Rhodospirillaceae bacterium]MBT6511115.1 hypothetical protein [Rhodospirillaceae bacterium]MBT7613336.1 hypothetical protein [Rhodospirillaceae bacterium]MDG2482948.1 cache domain-containing protein [Alphaproteobacteria bacterium]
MLASINRNFLGVGLACMWLAIAPATAVAQTTIDRGSAREAQAMVDRAIALYDAEGLLAFRTISQEPEPDFRDRDLYVFVFDQAGFMAAHALFPQFVGVNSVNSRDIEGKMYVREMIERASETGVWVDYVFLDPMLGEPAPKSAWVVWHEGFLFACGIYAGEIGI